jgi:hypothetical protein
MASSAPSIMFRHLFKTLSVSPAIASGMTSQHHQLQQRAPVSGTAKGKAKLKAGMPLKCSTIAMKGGTPSAGAGGRGRREAIERITQIAESCLKSPTPLRTCLPRSIFVRQNVRSLGSALRSANVNLMLPRLKPSPKVLVELMVAVYCWVHRALTISLLGWLMRRQSLNMS